MNGLVFDSEVLNRALDGGAASRGEMTELVECAQDNPHELFGAARLLRKNTHGQVVSFSKKAFFNLVNLCRDTCTYCTYKSEPAGASASMMDRHDVAELIRLAKRHRCVEALFVTGERPEERYGAARAWLGKNGFSSTAEYLVHCSEMALSAGLFPHTNAGNLTKKELGELKKTNASMGLMLENASERMMERGMPHHLAPSKAPAERLGTLRNAGELGIPMTTGLLVGIGETAYELVDSLFAIRGIHERYGNIQEVILQNFQPKPHTAMRNRPPAEETYFRIIVALTRIIMPQTNIQIPPNLSPSSYQDFLGIGINDWGGISPLTPDYVNPEFAWPAIDRVEKNCRDAGFDLKCRFPAYPEFLGGLDDNLKERIRPLSDDCGFVIEEHWR